MVTSPYEWKNLEWDENSQTDKQTKKHASKESTTQYTQYIVFRFLYIWFAKTINIFFSNVDVFFKER